MVERKSGAIVTLTGDSGRVGESRLVVTATARAAAIGFTRALAKEVARDGIRVNCVSLGLVETPSFAAHAGNLTPELRQRILGAYPLRRLGRVEDVPPAVLLLASPLSGLDHRPGPLGQRRLFDGLMVEQTSSLFGARSAARKTPACCAATVATSATSTRPACSTSPSSVAPMLTPGSWPTTPPSRAPRGVALLLTGNEPEVANIHLRAVSELPGYRTTQQPILAWPLVRFAGECVAAVVADSRYAAEDAAELVGVEYAPLPPIAGPEAAIAEGAPAVHDEVPDNVLLQRRFQAGDVDAALSSAHHVVERTFSTNRHAGLPLEGRGALAEWDTGQRRLTLYASTQVPHITRHGLADVLGLPEGQIRVVAPDVGGGFGVKATLYPEEVAVCLLAMRLGRPVRWVEDRRESLLASAHARDHRYAIAAGFDAEGHLLALRARIVVNVGAYWSTPGRPASSR